MTHLTMKYELLVSYTVYVGPDLKEYPFLYKVGKTDLKSPPLSFADIGYFFVDTADKRLLYLELTSKQSSILSSTYGVKEPIISLDLMRATGASLWQLTGKKLLQHNADYYQLEHRAYQDPRFLAELRKNGQHPASTLLVSNWDWNEMSLLSAFGDLGGAKDSPGETADVAAALCRLELQ